MLPTGVGVQDDGMDRDPEGSSAERLGVSFEATAIDLQ